MGNSKSFEKQTNQDETDADYEDLDILGPNLLYLFSEHSMNVLSSGDLAMKYSLPVTLLQDIREHLTTKLQAKSDRKEIITFDVYYSMCKSFYNFSSYSYNEYVQSFELFDINVDGKVPAELMLSLIRNTEINLKTNLARVTKTFAYCIYKPGFIDLFNPEERNKEHLVKNLILFMLRNRAESGAVSSPQLEQFMSLVMKRALIFQRSSEYFDLKAKEEKEEEENSKDGRSKSDLTLIQRSQQDSMSSESEEGGMKNGESLSVMVIMPWVVRMISALTLQTIDTNPVMVDLTMELTRKSLEELSLLMDTNMEAEKKSSLEVLALDLDQFFTSLHGKYKKAGLYKLWINLISSNMFKVLESLELIQGSQNSLDFFDKSLFSQMDITQKRVLSDGAQHLKLITFVGSDSDSDKSTSYYDLKLSNVKDQTVANYFFECNQPTYVTSATVELSEVKRAKYGMIFLFDNYCCCEDKFDLETDSIRFREFNTWDENRYQTEKKKQFKDSKMVPSGWFTFKDTLLNGSIQVGNLSLNQKVLVKLLLCQPMENTSDTTSVKLTIKLHGYPISDSFFKLCNYPKSLNEKQHLIMKTFSFLSSITSSLTSRLACEKLKFKHSDYNFKEINNLNFVQATGIGSYIYKAGGSQGGILAKHPLCAQSSYFEFKLWSKSGDRANFTIGLFPENSEFNSCPGLSTGSYGFNSYEGSIYESTNYPTIDDKKAVILGDTMGCGIDFGTNMSNLYFTHNGKRVFDKPYKNLPNMYPCCVCMDTGESFQLIQKLPWRFKKDPQPSIAANKVPENSAFFQVGKLQLKDLNISKFWHTFNYFKQDRQYSFDY